MVAATGGSPRQIQPEFAVTRFPVWSPDGKHILFLGDRDRRTVTADRWDWWVAPLDAGSVVRTGALAALRKHGLPSRTSRSNLPSEVLIPAVWSAEDRIVFAADIGDSRNIWQVAVSPTNWSVTGPPQRLTFGAGTEDLPSTIAGSRVVFSNLTANVNIWSLPVDHHQGLASGEIRRLTEATSIDIQPAISADGQRLVFASDRAGNFDVWTKDLRTGEEKAITMSPVFESRPAITADGSKVAYNDWAGQKPKLNIASLGGHGEEGLTANVCDDCYLAWDWSPDNRILLYWSKDLHQIGALDVASREKAIVLKHPEHSLLRSNFSPDGRWVAFDVIGAPDQVQSFVAPFEGMSLIGQDAWILATSGGALNSVSRWSPDGHSLYFLSDRDGYLCLWRQRLDPETRRPLGEAKPVYHLHGTRRSISSVPPHFLEISVARNQIVFPMGERTGNIWMAEWNH